MPRSEETKVWLVDDFVTTRVVGAAKLALCQSLMQTSQTEETVRSLLYDAI